MKNKEEVREMLEAHAQASSYNINNTWLSKHERAIVESVFSFPQGIFIYSLFTLLVFFQFGFLKAYIISSLLSMIAIPISLSFNGMWIVFVGSVFYVGNISIITELALALYLYLHGMHKYAMIFVSFAFVIGNLLIPSFFLWNVLYSRIPIAGSKKKIRGINPRYVIAKKLFGTSFPFEEKLIKDSSSTW